MPQMLVFNKLDRLEPTPAAARAARRASSVDGGVRVPRVFVSARDGEGLDALRQVLAEAVAGARPRLELARNGLPADADSADEPAASTLDNPSPATSTRSPHDHESSTPLRPTGPASDCASVATRRAAPCSPARCGAAARAGRTPTSWPTAATTARPTSTNSGATSTASSAACSAARAAAPRRNGPATTAAAARNFQPDMKSAGIGAGLIAGVVALIWLGSGFFIVQEGQQAVVTSFGKYSHTVGRRLPVAPAVPVPGPRDGARDAAALGRGRPQHRRRRPPGCASRRC